MDRKFRIQIDWTVQSPGIYHCAGVQTLWLSIDVQRHNREVFRTFPETSGDAKIPCAYCRNALVHVGAAVSKTASDCGTGFGKMFCVPADFQKPTKMHRVATVLHGERQSQGMRNTSAKLRDLAHDGGRLGRPRMGCRGKRGGMMMDTTVYIRHMVRYITFSFPNESKREHCLC